MKDVKMKSFVILVSSLLLASTCCAMNNPPKDNGLLLRRSAPTSSSQQMPGVKPTEEIDLSKMSVNSRARYMTDFVAGELEKGQCSYEGTLIDLEGQLNAKVALNPDAFRTCERDAAVLAWERAGDDPESEDELTASKVSSQTKYRTLGAKDRTMSAGPMLQSIIARAPAAQPQTATHLLAGPSSPDDSDDEKFNDTVANNTSESAPAVTIKSKRIPPQDELLFDMDD